ncbi:hypothetical protein KAU33_09325 [Candidatus Dependentiae bacterium]|nr:hypothetical protein [Candidatus Dependentiae bacterium]
MFLSEMPGKFNWRKMLPHLTKLVNQFGLRQKDVSFSVMEYLSWDFSEDELPIVKESSLAIENAFKSALKGEDRLGAFYLLKYTEGSGYEILRAPLKRCEMNDE